MNQGKIGVLIVDDSAVIRRLLAGYLKKYGDIEVVGTAADPYEARDKVVALKPDVLTLDVEMPRMDGINFLKKLMIYHPIPTIMVSSLTRKGCEITLQALEIGAIDFVTKPSATSLGEVNELMDELYRKIKAAATANVKRLGGRGSADAINSNIIYKPIAAQGQGNRIVAIGSSTGGTEALKEVLGRMPDNAPGVLIAQHMPANFTRYLAARLDKLASVDVCEAKDGMCVTPGTAIIAPGDCHMELRKDGPTYYVETSQGAKVNNQRPSVDVLFNSVAKCAANNAIGVIMTGMGADGAIGLLNMRKAGAKTVAQDEESCVVFGMPKEAIRIGAVDAVVSLTKIPETIFSFLGK